MKRKLLSLLSLVCLVAAGCHHHHHHPNPWMANPAVILPDQNRGKFLNIAYTKPTKSLSQTLDLYIPLAAKPPYPLIIWVHGGSWMYGDKNPCFACNTYLGDYAIASVNYRLDNEVAFPAQIHDLKAAVRYLRLNAKKYHLDPDRFGAWGSSAGGHLVALLGASNGHDELEGSEGSGGTSSEVQAVCDWCGPTDFATADAQSGPNIKIRFSGPSSPVFVLMGGRMDPKSIAQASPVTYVSKHCPPFLIMHGDLDDAIPPAQSQELYEALKAKGVDVTYKLLPGCGHSFMAPEHFQLVKDFFDTRLKKGR